MGEMVDEDSEPSWTGNYPEAIRFPYEGREYLLAFSRRGELILYREGDTE
jgi:hypothetical protein